MKYIVIDCREESRVEALKVLVWRLVAPTAELYGQTLQAASNCPWWKNPVPAPC